MTLEGGNGDSSFGVTSPSIEIPITQKVVILKLFYSLRTASIIWIQGKQYNWKHRDCDIKLYNGSWFLTKIHHCRQLERKNIKKNSELLNKAYSVKVNAKMSEERTQQKGKKHWYFKSTLYKTNQTPRNHDWLTAFERLEMQPNLSKIMPTKSIDFQMQWNNRDVFCFTCFLSFFFEVFNPFNPFTQHGKENYFFWLPCRIG